MVHGCEPESARGADRHLANLQAFGNWWQPSATEFFTTTLSNLSTDRQSTLPAYEANLSPASQVCGQNGDLIGLEIGSGEVHGRSLCVTQVTDGSVVTADEANNAPAVESSKSTEIIRHRAENPGDKFAAAETGPLRRATTPGRHRLGAADKRVDAGG